MKKNNGNGEKHGFVLTFLFAVCSRIAAIFASGVIYKIFTSHDKVRDAFESSATYQIFKRIKNKTKGLSEKLKKNISRQFERSIILSFISGMVKNILMLPGRVCGAFSLTWSAYVILIALIKRLVLYQSDGIGITLACGILVFVSSIPLMFSEKSLFRLCSESPLIFSILTNIFGVPAEVFKCSERAKVGQSGAVILGIAFGLLTYFISPLYMLIALAGLIVVALIFAYPEGGVVISIAISPLLGLSFAPSIVLAAFVILTAISYLIKLIRGKRVFKFGITEFAFFGFMLAVFMGGFAPGESNTLENALLCCSLMLIFPLAVNLMKYKRWIKTCVLAFLIPGALVAFAGIAQYCLGLAPSGWTDETLFSGITSRAVSVFNNPNILGVYLATVFPLALMVTLPGRSSKVRVLGGIASSFIVVCTVLTFSRSAWMALVLGGILFAVLVSPKGILWVFPAGGIATIAALIFPDSIGARLANFVTLSDSANSYRVSVWNSSWDMLSHVFAGGIGMGEEAFKTAYINFASAGTQYAVHSHSLYIQIALQIGVIGLLLFLLSLFIVAGKTFSATAKTSSDNDLMRCAKASVAGAASLLIAGMADYTWYNFRVFFIFWALLGFACAAVNLNEKLHFEPWDTESDETQSYITVPIPHNIDNTAESEKGDSDNG